MSVFHASVLLGDGAFETLRSYGPGLFALDLHLARLAAGLRALDIGVPTSLRDEALTARALVRGEARVRILVPRDGPRIVTAEAFDPPRPQSVRLSEAPARSPQTPWKSTSYGANLADRHRARAAGFEDVVFTTPRGGWLEGATCNVFAVVDGRPVTPKTVGVLPGVTRKVVLDLAAAAGLGPLEAPLTPARLDRATEVFVTSTLRGVVAVRGAGARTWRAPGPVTRALASWLEGYARDSSAVGSP